MVGVVAEACKWRDESGKPDVTVGKLSGKVAIEAAAVVPGTGTGTEGKPTKLTRDEDAEKSVMRAVVPIRSEAKKPSIDVLTLYGPCGLKGNVKYVVIDTVAELALALKL